MTNTDKERADFEALAKSREYPLATEGGNRDYRHHQTREALFFYHAGREAERAEAVTDADLTQAGEGVEWIVHASISIAAMVGKWYDTLSESGVHGIPADLIWLQLKHFQPKPEPSPDVEAENKQLRGTLEYILAQSKNDYPGVLSVIRANASAALDRVWQKTVSGAMASLTKPEGK